MYATAHAYTGQVTFYKALEKKRPCLCLTGHPVYSKVKLINFVEGKQPYSWVNTDNYYSSFRNNIEQFSGETIDILT